MSTSVMAGCVLLGVAASIGRFAATTRSGRMVRRRLTAVPQSDRESPERFGRLTGPLARADIALSPVDAMRLATAATISAVAVGAVVGGPVAGAVLGVVTGIAGPVALLLLDSRRDRRADAGVPDLLDDVARALRSGAAPASALEEAASGAAPSPTRAEACRVVDDIGSGLGLVEALDRWQERRPSGPVRLTVAALAIGVSTGGVRSRAIEAVGATLREGQAVDQEARALATQARSSAVVIALAPIGFATLATLTDVKAGAFLLGTPVGAACLVAGLFLDGLGAWWMHRITSPAAVGETSSPTTVTEPVSDRGDGGARTWPSPRVSSRRVTAVALVAVFLSVSVNPVLGVAVVAAAVVRARNAPQRASRAQEAAIRDQLPEVVDLLALGVGAGLTMPDAVGVVADRAPGPLGDSLATVGREVNRGAPVADALERARQRCGSQSSGLFAALVASDRHGSPLAPALDRLGHQARLDRRRAAEERARHVPVKLLFPLVVCVLPAFGLLTVVPLLVNSLGTLR
jgi:Flp pilus assembly protein TadB